MAYRKNEILSNPGGYVVLPEIKKLPEEFDKVFEQLKYGKVYAMEILENLVEYHKSSMNFLIYHRKSEKKEKYSWENDLIRLFFIAGAEFAKSKIYDKAISLLELVLKVDTKKEFEVEDILAELYLRANKTIGLIAILGEKRDEIYLTTCLLANIIDDDIPAAREYLEDLEKLNPKMIEALSDVEDIRELLEKIEHKELELSQEAQIALIKYVDYFMCDYHWEMLKYLIITDSEENEEGDEGVTVEIYDLLEEAKISDSYRLAREINKLGILIKKQLQRIKGIGPKTLEKLEVVGVEFREN